ncbi:MAG: phosphoglycolate phosphatase, partial [Thermomicrobiales bacterium]|nr:phosphoglycolate phosphatase [Thermomicrobiales bacterium]
GLLANDLSDLVGRLARHVVTIGTDAGSQQPIVLGPGETTVMIAGPSGSGKSTAMLGMLEQLSLSGYQYCAIDPEGDYLDTPYGISIGNWEQAPAVEDVVQLLRRPGNDAIACLLGVQLSDRPSYFAALQVALAAQRARTGRPHWVAIDEAHHLLPAWGSVTKSLPADVFANTIFVTVNPSHLTANVLERIDMLVVTGDRPRETVREYCAAIGIEPPAVPEKPGERDVLVWRRNASEQPVFAQLIEPRREIRRHRRKYARGVIDSAHHFVFTGPAQEVNRSAENLVSFIEIATNVDDDVWLFHLHRGDFTRWFRETIKDDELVAEARRAEAIAAAGISESRAIVRRAIERRYTLPT